MKKQAKQAKLDMEALTRSADEYMQIKQRKKEISPISKSNALREKAKEKKDLCSQLDSKLKDNQNDLKTV